MTDPQEVKSTWHWGSPDLPQLGDEVTMLHPRAEPCNCQCPWLTENQGKTVNLWYDHEVPGIAMPEGEFSFAPWKRVRVWDDYLKDGIPGYGNLCHVRLKGTERRADDTWAIVGHQCTSALVMQQRELLRHVEHGTSALSAPGAARVASDLLGRSIAVQQLRELDLGELLAQTHPCLLDPKIGSEAVAPPLSERELNEWYRLREGAPRSAR